MKKKLLVIMLALCLVLSAFVGCAPADPVDPETPPTSGSSSGTTPTTPTTPTATPPDDVEGLAVDALGNITWTEGDDAVAWSVQYKLGSADYVQYAIVNEGAVSVTDILKSIDVDDLKEANAKNMNVQVAAIDDELEIGDYVELANVLGTYGNGSARKLRVVTNIAELKEVGDNGDYVVLANDITLTNDQVQANIVYSTPGVDGVPGDESSYYVGRRLFNGVLNGLGHTISYTLNDAQLRTHVVSVNQDTGAESLGGYGWGGIWERVENGALMNLNINADITKPHSQDPMNPGIEWYTCVYAARTIASTIYNCDFNAVYHRTGSINGSTNMRFGMGQFVTDTQIVDCDYDLRVFVPVDPSADPLTWRQASPTEHTAGVIAWSAPGSTSFTNCTYAVSSGDLPVDYANAGAAGNSALRVAAIRGLKIVYIYPAA